MKKFLLLTILGLAICTSAKLQAQDYQSAVGLRLGYPLAVSYKTFISEQGALEGFAGFRSWIGYSWVSINGAYQHHFPISGVDGLQWYAGGGAGIQFWNWKGTVLDDGNTSFGIFGALGLDYKFANAPINLSLDWMPTFFINGYLSGFGGGYGSLAARYTLK